ncbi:anti-phage defense-associated sirtuin Dsr1 [uncultured Ruegeria sp.]|uniref:anti-phage defense-associated sirtuin Dsr1 n=1 Tax=uncultured Ruegeria sp. TaxID=259304 RepID=UPI00262070AE|nr:anti-phage defense-associated sirtuin Dsr1 [uncultured Ruegeria sp.]
MQYIPNGPDVPEALLEAHEDGNVVFFCGAGVSYPARLPTFWGLVKAVYVELGEDFSSSEGEAFNSYKYDTTLGLLEQRLPNGRLRVREAIAAALQPNLGAKKSTQTHEALLGLSRTRSGATRLITTNFDRVFEEVIKTQKVNTPVHAAPLLPVPKNKWDGLIYLHGLLDGTNSEANLNSLVATSGDFGLAYLIERWAARFVSELFRNYTVCFVGYSINDPILRYMMDALAADKMMGESPLVAYAFGNYARGKKDQAETEWAAKNVAPVLYKNHKHHYYLHETLHAWANSYRDGINGKSSIVARHAYHKPKGNTAQDDFVKRMVWALSDQTGLPAKHFAQLDPVPPIEWLEEFSNKRFGIEDLPRFGVPQSELFNTIHNPEFKFSLLSRPAPSHLAPRMSLVDLNGGHGSDWDKVMEELAKWLAKHLEQPETLFWVIGQGSNLSLHFKSHLQRALKDANNLSPAMRKLWEFVVSGYARSLHFSVGLSGWEERFKKYGDTPIVRKELKDALRPLLRISRQYSFRTDRHGTSDRISAIANVEITLASDHVHSAYDRIQKTEQFNGFLPHILTDMSELLSETLDLMCEAEISSEQRDYSYIQLPSISDHEQNRDYNDWTLLVTLCRDAWVASVENNHDTAKAMLTIWASYKHSVFRRLVFFALAQKPSIVSFATSVSWVLSDGGSWLWATSTMRELMRLFVSLGPVLTNDEMQKLQGAILEGPPRESFNEDVNEDEFQYSSDRMRWLRLKKLLSNGGAPIEEVQTFIEKTERSYPEWRLASNERDEFPVWSSRGEEQPVEQSPKDVKKLVVWLRNNPSSESAFSGDNWPERCRDDFRRSFSALRNLASEDEWLPRRWADALYAWSNDELTGRSWKHVAPVLVNMPDEHFIDALRAIAWWLSRVSKKIEVHEEHFIKLIDRTIELDSTTVVDPDSISIDHAINHPVGQAASSLLNWWFSTELEDDQGLPEEVSSRFAKMCDAENKALWLGSVILAQQIIPLYRVDKNWTKQHLITAFEWDVDVNKAAAMWDSFLHAPQIYLPLLEDLEIPFLAVPDHIDVLEEQCLKQYAGFLTHVTLSGASVFSPSKLKDVFSKLPSVHLEAVAQTLFQALQGAGDQQAEFLKNRVIPFVKRFWPSKPEARTPMTFRYFAQMSAISGVGFDEAFACFKDHLGQTNEFGYLLTLLKEVGVAADHPREVLEILNATIPQNVQLLYTGLKSLLDTIQRADPDLSNHPNYFRLSILSQQHEN